MEAFNVSLDDFVHVDDFQEPDEIEPPIQSLSKITQKTNKPESERLSQNHEKSMKTVDQLSTPTLDMSAWDDYHLDSKITAALANQSFSAPTEIQSAVLEVALKERRDLIGAAETVTIRN